MAGAGVATPVILIDCSPLSLIFLLIFLPLIIELWMKVPHYQSLWHRRVYGIAQSQTHRKYEVNETQLWGDLSYKAPREFLKQTQKHVREI